jgi:hypothetical protein
LKRWLSALAALSLASGALVALPGTANAAVPPFSLCRYTGQNPVIKIVSAATPVYRTAVVTAANQWNRTAAPGVFQMATSGANLHVSGLSSAEDYWAETGARCRANRFWAETVRLRYNTRTMNPLTPRQKWIVMAHELGHAYGLGHTSMACGRPSVMEQGREKFGCPGSPPWRDDVDGVVRIYFEGVV